MGAGGRLRVGCDSGVGIFEEEEDIPGSHGKREGGREGRIGGGVGKGGGRGGE